VHAVLVGDLDALDRRREVAPGLLEARLALVEGRQPPGVVGGEPELGLAVVVDGAQASTPSRVCTLPAASPRRPRARLRSAVRNHSSCQLSASPGVMRPAAWKHSLIAPPPSCVSPSARRNW